MEMKNKIDIFVPAFLNCRLVFAYTQKLASLSFLVYIKVTNCDLTFNW